MSDHLTDDALVRRLDGELGPEERDRLERHLGACPHCRDALHEFERFSRRFSRMVTLVDPPRSGSDRAPLPATDRWRVAPLWRAAAVIALVAGLAIAIAPVRAWVVRQLGLSDGLRVEAPGGAENVGTERAAEDEVRVAFVPEGDRFVVRVTSPQAAGRVSLVTAPGAVASAEITGTGNETPDLLVVPDGVAIRNDPSSTLDYRVAVPSTLSRVEVHVANRVVWSGSPRELEHQRITIELDG